VSREFESRRATEPLKRLIESKAPSNTRASAPRERFQMKTSKASVTTLVFVISVPLSSAAQYYDDARVGFDHYEPPVPVKANGRTVLAYELHVTNFYPGDITLSRLEVLDPDHPQHPLQTFEGEALRKCLMNPLAADRRATTRKIGPLQRGVLVLMVTIGADAPVPCRLLHKLRFVTTSERGTETTTEAAFDGVTVSTESALAIASPVGRGHWWTINVANERVDGHRLGIAYCNGTLRFPQRYAVDFVRLNGDGQAAIDEGKKNTDWFGYGEEVYAVADATVIYALGFVVENEPFGQRKALCGNCIWLDLGDGRYALYEHMQRNSLRVKKGDRVKTGQVLGLIGNSGNSDLPHLHFSLHDAPVAMRSTSVPFVVEELELLGTRCGPGFTDPWQPHPSSSPVCYKQQWFRNDCVYRFVP
jgi:murein DD-endopeptidase